ncbi:MAG TPA: DUF6404 family protein [Gemmataceae bacterium]|nr:DUF6404 family protein [Gemmataceae bacterium]
MTHRQKVDHLIEDLGKRGIGAYTVAPPLFRLLWALGLKVPPPFFLGFFALTFLMGGMFSVLWGAAMWGGFLWLFERQPQQEPIEVHAVFVLASAAAGLLFGLCMAAYCRWKAKRLVLPPWDSYPEAGE